MPIPLEIESATVDTAGAVVSVSHDSGKGVGRSHGRQEPQASNV